MWHAMSRIDRTFSFVAREYFLWEFHIHLNVGDDYSSERGGSSWGETGSPPHISYYNVLTLPESC